ncbi:hypothetical protein PHAVU_008G251800 [Phaseolus vulgaris]|uniref:WRKY domain-containing protein n=2 Tax=Phaseolus vulgaris TaxID=3885 RepID=V7B8C6_PHAVU|nr:hypothetical protein PHAVU_008G251800g [Phaseolus vulgaris]ESW14084.1 hypothetical protein PHAVU_008G251800g [Phaseolus vulgaris]
MSLRNFNPLEQKSLCRVVGFISSVIGLICYAFSSSFNHLFGEWNFLKIILYTMVSFSISGIMLFLKKWKRSGRFSPKVHAGVLVLLLTSFYSFVYDKSVNGKPNGLSLISCGAFALMSLCLSRQIDLGFEADLLNFFLGSLTVQLMEINLMLFIVAAILCYCFMILRSKESESEIGTVPMEDHVTIELGTAYGGERGADDQQIPLLRMVGEGYNWKKCEDKTGKGNENQVSYYKCTHPNCYVNKKVVRTIDGKIVEIHYQGNHAHCKRLNNMKRNSSSEYLYSLLTSDSVTTESFASQSNQQLDYDVHFRRTHQYPHEI